MQNQPSDHVNWYSDEAVDQPAHLLKDDTDKIDTADENEKEHEGYYPNQLDDEMKNYHYGDKLMPSYYGWYLSGNDNSY
jgi:hypothetical protein